MQNIMLYMCGKYKVISIDFSPENSICMKSASKWAGLHCGSKIDFVAQFCCHLLSSQYYRNFQQHKKQHMYVQFMHLFSFKCSAKCLTSLWANN